MTLTLNYMLLLKILSTVQVLHCNEDELTFIAIGDWGMDKANGSVNGQLRVADSMARWANDVNNLNFILTLGDNFYPVGTFNVTDKQYDTKWREVYINPYPSLRVDWQIVLGNHDHKLNNGKNQIEFSKFEPLWKIPNFFYSFTKELKTFQILFVIIDTELMLNNSNKKEQLTFLDKTLFNSKANWKFVATHYPIFSTSTHGNNIELINDLRPILINNNADFYIFGHDHVLQHLSSVANDPVDYIGSGGGSQIPYDQVQDHIEELKKWNLKSNMYGQFNGFVGFTLTKYTATVDFIKDNGDIFYSFTRVRN
ncbi:DgyrCDS14889 [Dimorphilus gyrociliatus]|uniref:DgyrCDS14889 n=1 Tax=Dimorphilus gyrociliatus TaxID=2664684 RepID=A0A7I8WFI2_9ANNE|nr:DgyrCDS14889 [Dimorphilus gyrociliatus]